MSENQTTKECKGCGKILSISDFYKTPNTKDGRFGKCKSCYLAMCKERTIMLKRTSLEWVERNAEYQRLHKRRQREQNPETFVDDGRIKRWNQRNRIKRNAHSLVRWALLNGKIKASPCHCGQKGEAHHEDYSKPLDVVWLCKQHHTERHLEINKEKRALKFATTNNPK